MHNLRSADESRIPHPRAGSLCAVLIGCAFRHAPAAHTPPTRSDARRPLLVSLDAAAASTGEPALPLVELPCGRWPHSRAAGRSLSWLGCDVGCNPCAGGSASQTVAPGRRIIHF